MRPWVGTNINAAIARVLTPLLSSLPFFVDESYLALTSSKATLPWAGMAQGKRV